MEKLLNNEVFWIVYGAIAVLTFGVWFVLIGTNKWYREMTDYDAPKGLVRFFASAVEAAGWPATFVGYMTILGMKLVADLQERWAAEEDEEESIRCWKCASQIATADSFCRFCGADQTELNPEDRAEPKSESSEPSNEPKMREIVRLKPTKRKKAGYNRLRDKE